MAKIALKGKMFHLPYPTTLVGAKVNDKPTYLAIGYCGAMDHDPPTFYVASLKSHYTNIGIRENKTFSVNYPPTGLVVETDYCGIYSGRKRDKSQIFTSFYGELKTAPMIEECRLNLECEVIQIIETGAHETFIGRAHNAYAEEDCLVDGEPDITKVDPIILSYPDYKYWRLGDYLAKAISVGKSYQAD